MATKNEIQLKCNRLVLLVSPLPGALFLLRSYSHTLHSLYSGFGLNAPWTIAYLLGFEIRLNNPTLLRSGLVDKPPLAQTNPTPHRLPIILISNGCHSTVNWKSTEAVPGWPVWPWCREPRCRRQPADKRSPVCRWPVPFSDCLRHVRRLRPTINCTGSWCDSSPNPNLCHRERTCSLGFKRGFCALKHASL